MLLCVKTLSHSRAKISPIFPPPLTRGAPYLPTRMKRRFAASFRAGTRREAGAWSMTTAGFNVSEGKARSQHLRPQS